MLTVGWKRTSVLISISACDLLTEPTRGKATEDKTPQARTCWSDLVSTRHSERIFSKTRYGDSYSTVHLRQICIFLTGNFFLCSIFLVTTCNILVVRTHWWIANVNFFFDVYYQLNIVCYSFETWKLAILHYIRLRNIAVWTDLLGSFTLIDSDKSRLVLLLSDSVQ